MSEIKAIETEYNGYRFRSRLEARWAVFFDTGHLVYEYEPEGFQLKNGTKYLPDFYLPDLDVYVEVKRDTPEGRKEILEKCEGSIVWGGPIKQLIILSEVPEGRSPDGGLWHYPAISWRDDHPYWGWWFFHDHGDQLSGNISAAYYPYPYWYLFDERNPRRKNSIIAVTDYILKNCQLYDGQLPIETMIEMQEDFNPLTFKALRAARQARFEHGETPTIGGNK